MNRLTYERRLQLLALAAGLPGSLISLILLWTGSYSTSTAWTLTLLIVGFWLGFALSLRHRVVFSLQTLSNLLAALREEDFSVRGRGAKREDAMGEVMIEVNALSETLRQQRLGALEAGALLRTVMEEIDVAIFTFDNETKLRLVNRAGERLLARPVERLLGFTADELGLQACLEGESSRTMELNFAGGSGRWGMRRGSFRQGGLPHRLIVLSDLSRTLRDASATNSTTLSHQFSPWRRASRAGCSPQSRRLNYRMGPATRSWRTFARDLESFVRARKRWLDSWPRTRALRGCRSQNWLG